MKHILFLTGTRADFGKMYPLASEAKNNGFRVTFLVTGMHMLSEYGLTKMEVHNKKDFEVIEFMNQRHGDPQDIVLAKSIIGFSDYFNEIKPDMVVIHGDRVEAMACSIVCATNYILSVHIEGGEISGTIDEVLRHCNTKLCTIHMVSSEIAKQRILKMGEIEENIFIIGSPELEVHKKESGININNVKSRYSIDFDEYGISIFHPVTSEKSNNKKNAEIYFQALTKSKKKFVVIKPNNDPGSEEINNILEGLNKNQFKILPSMRFNYFSELIKNSSLFIGNSSAGAREAPFLGIASIDIGSRQNKRSISSSVKHFSGNDSHEIEIAILENWNKKYPQHNAFGDGNSSKRFVNLLMKKDLWKISLQKYFND